MLVSIFILINIIQNTFRKLSKITPSVHLCKEYAMILSNKYIKQV